jgi:O-antigen ligase
MPITSATLPNVTAANATSPDDVWVFRGLIAILVWAPLPLGSNRFWAIGVLVALCVGVSVLAGYVWRGALDQAIERLSRFRLPITVFGALVALAWAQTLALPTQWVATLSPEAWQVQLALGESATQTLSLDAFQSRMMAALSLAYFLMFVLTLLTVRSRERLDRLAVAFVSSALLQVVVGAALFSVGAHYWLFHSEVTHARVIGTYVYHNSLAGYLCMALSIGIGLMLARLEPGQGHVAHGWRQRVLATLRFLLSAKMRLRLMLVIIVIGLVLTRSRMGNAAFFASMLLVGLYTIVMSRRFAPATISLIASLVIIDVLVVGTWVGLEKVVTRVQETAVMKSDKIREETVEERTDTARMATDIVRDFPLAGTGGGSFYSSFIRYRQPGDVYWDHTHNDFVEIAADFGLVFLGLMGVLVALTLWRALTILARRRSSLPRGMAFGVAMSIVALLFHSAVDFNLQIPANALSMSVILAMAWVAGALPSRTRRRSGNQSPRTQLYSSRLP